MQTGDEPLPPYQSESLPLPVEEQIDDLCVRFEQSCKAGQIPQLEEYLLQVSDGVRGPLLQELLRIELHYRLLKGEKPTAEEYLRRFPDQETRIRAVLAAAAPPDAAGPDEPQTTVHYQPVAPPRSDRYVPRQLHARGGIGEVWLALDSDIGREVALKRLRPGREEAQDRFLAEAQVTGQLEHPSIVPVHDLGLDAEGRPFYVMTFVRGRTLKDAIADYHSGTDKEPAEVQLCRLLEIFVKVCQATAYAHHRGVIHRDLKPDNVMLGEYGEALVVDWGMAKVRSQPDLPGRPSAVHINSSGSSTDTEAGAVLGSPAYMSPEVADGRAGDADERTDVYLLGATLYHLLTGRLPRQGSSHIEMVELARNVPPPPPRQLKPDIPRALEAICRKAMAHRAQDRYADALKLAGDVQRYLAGAPVSAYREPLLAQAWRWCKRHRRLLGRSLAAAAFLGLAVFAGVQIQEYRTRAEEKEREAEEQRRQAEKLRGEKKIRQDLENFQRKVDERQFYTMLTTPAGEQQLHYDSSRGQRAGEEALEIADQLTGALQLLPLPAEQEALNDGLHDLLLLVVQSQIQQAKRAEVRGLLDRLERAEALRGPSRGNHHLRASCYRLLGVIEQADAEDRRAGELPATARDHFLLAEEFRSKAHSLPSVSADGTQQKAKREQLLKNAVDHYQQARRIDPRYFWCYFHLGRCYLSLGLGSEALEALDTCVALRPDQPWGYGARGLALGLIRRYAEGEADLKKALELDPDFRPALLNRGILAWLQGERERALADFGTVLEQPERLRLIEAAYYRGQLQLERGKRREALEDFDFVAAKNPGFAPVYLNRAQVHCLQGNDDKVLADLNTYLQLGNPSLDPKHPEASAWRGRLLAELAPSWGLEPMAVRKTLQRALDELSRARSLGCRSARLFSDLGSVQEQLGKLPEAIQNYEEALKTAEPALKIEVLNRRGWLFAQAFDPPSYALGRKDFAEALRLDAKEFAETFPLDLKKAEAHTGLGYLWACQKNPAEAQREAARALRLGAGDYLVLHNVACIYAVLSRNDRQDVGPDADTALTFIQQALEVWKRKKIGPNELVLIQQEAAFKHLEKREEFRKLVGQKGP